MVIASNMLLFFSERSRSEITPIKESNSVSYLLFFTDFKKIKNFCCDLVMSKKPPQMYCEGKKESLRHLQKYKERRKVFMNKLVSKIDMAVLKAKMALMEKKEASDQLIVMFIIIAVAAGIAGLLYIFATGTLLPNFQNKLTNLINNWFNHS